MQKIIGGPKERPAVLWERGAIGRDGKSSLTISLPLRARLLPAVEFSRAGALPGYRREPGIPSIGDCRL